MLTPKIVECVFLPLYPNVFCFNLGIDFVTSVHCSAKLTYRGCHTVLKGTGMSD